MRDDLPQGRITLLLTDIEGSTRMLQQLGAEGYARAQAEHRDLLRKAFTAQAGVEVDTQGDAFFFAFPTADGCLIGAITATRALAAHDWAHQGSVRVRMGMHSGEAQRTEEGYVGVTVNKAARIAALGHGGQILMSAETRELLNADDSEVADSPPVLREMGEHRLKDLDGTHALYQVVIPELPADFPPLRSVASRPNNLPVPLTPFVGRSELVTRVRDLISENDVRVVSLVGPGGMGKTRLSIRVADELLHRFEDGAFFVGMVSITEARFTIPEIARTVGIKEATGQSPIDSLCAGLAEARMLLVIDNLEQVPGAAREVAGLLARCPGIKILATSRQPLRLTGERVFRIPPLSLPKPGERLSVAKIGQFEAVRLFVDRGSAANADFSLTAENADIVVSICRKVDALPFGIELAAARLQTMDAGKLLKVLDRRLKVLTGGTGDMLDHQQTLRDLIGWSYDLLNEDERRLWERLSVFEGGCAFDAAEFVCNEDDDYLMEVDVDELAGKSLLNIEFTPGSSFDKVVTGEDAERRILMLETLAEFAREKLKDRDDAQGIAARHSEWFLQEAERAANEMRGPNLTSWLTELDREQANLRAALERLLTQPDTVEQGRSLSGALWFYWYERGQLSEGQRWLEQALASGAQEASPARARVLLGLANLLRSQNLPAEARPHCVQALADFEALGQEEDSADARCQLGVIELYLGNLDAAADLLEKGVATLRALGNQGRLAFSLVCLGALEQIKGSYDAAADWYRQSLELGRASQDANYVATALLNLGEVTRLQGDDLTAARFVRDSLVIYHELNVRNAIAYALELLAGIDLDAGRADEAVQLFAGATRLREEIHSPLESFNLERYEKDLASARNQLGADDYERLWREAQLRTLGETIALALLDDAQQAGRRSA